MDSSHFWLLIVSVFAFKSFFWGYKINVKHVHILCFCLTSFASFRHCIRGARQHLGDVAHDSETSTQGPTIHRYTVQSGLHIVSLVFNDPEQRGLHTCCWLLTIREKQKTFKGKLRHLEITAASVISVAGHQKPETRCLLSTFSRLISSL